jgi:signal peptidase I
MSPTLNDGDRVFVSRGMGFVSEYTHGDLVMVRINDDIGSRYIIKRIAAVPGDVLIIDNGQVTINGVVALFRYERHGEDSLRFELYQDYYFLIGDNHTFSTDSRDFGPLHRSDLRGRVLFRFMGGSFTIN